MTINDLIASRKLGPDTPVIVGYRVRRCSSVALVDIPAGAILQKHMFGPRETREPLYEIGELCAKATG